MRDPRLGTFLLGPLYREFQDSFEYKMSSIAHVFWTVKRNKRNHKKFLSKIFFPKNNKEKNFVNNPGARTTRCTRFQKYRLTICASSTLFMPSAGHLRVILSLSIVRVRRKKFFLFSRAPRINFRIFVGRS